MEAYTIPVTSLINLMAVPSPNRLKFIATSADSSSDRLLPFLEMSVNNRETLNVT
jgi:hypothetical protein